MKNSNDINTTLAFDHIKYAIHNQHIYNTVDNNLKEHNQTHQSSFNMQDKYHS